MGKDWNDIIVFNKNHRKSSKSLDTVLGSARTARGEPKNKVHGGRWKRRSCSLSTMDKDLAIRFTKNSFLFI
jgi:hypothetical protein